MSDKIALITGAGRGIGRAISVALAAEGVSLMITSRTQTELEETRDLIAGQVPVTIIPADVASNDSVIKLFSKIKEETDRLDFVVNNAGFVKLISVADTDEEVWTKTLDVNLSGPYRIIREALPLLKKAKGKILSISSLAGTSGYDKFPGFGAYSAAKSGLIALSEVLALELKESGISVYTVSPGGVDTQMLREVLPDFKANLQPEDIAKKVVEVLMDKVQAATGDNIVVDGM